MREGHNPRRQVLQEAMRTRQTPTFHSYSTRSRGLLPYVNRAGKCGGSRSKSAERHGSPEPADRGYVFAGMVRAEGLESTSEAIGGYLALRETPGSPMPSKYTEE